MELNQTDIFLDKTCIEYNNSICIHEVSVLSMDQIELRNFLVSVLWISFVFVLSLQVVGWVVKVLFAKMFGGKK